MSDFVSTLRSPFASITETVRDFDPSATPGLWHALNFGGAGPVGSVTAVNAITATWTQQLERTIEHVVRPALAKLSAAAHRQEDPATLVVCPWEYDSMRYIEVQDAALALRPPTVNDMDPSTGDSSRLVALVYAALPEGCDIRTALREDECVAGDRGEMLVVCGPAFRLRSVVVSRDWYPLATCLATTRAIATKQRQQAEQQRVEQLQKEAAERLEKEWEPSLEQKRLNALEQKINVQLAASEAERERLAAIVRDLSDREYSNRIAVGRARLAAQQAAESAAASARKNTPSIIPQRYR
jgi:hypothetical protein